MSRRAPTLVTDAPRAPGDERRHRERVYAVLMVVHVLGLVVGASLYFAAHLLGLVVLIVTGPLPWVAVVLANSPSRRRPRRVSRPPEQGSSRP